MAICIWIARGLVRLDMLQANAPITSTITDGIATNTSRVGQIIAVFCTYTTISAIEMVMSLIIDIAV